MEGENDLSEIEFWEKKVLVAFFHLKRAEDDYYAKNLIRQSVSERDRTNIDRVRTEFLDVLQQAVTQPFGLDLLFNLKDQPDPRLWGHIIDELTKFDDAKATDYLSALASSEVIVPDLREYYRSSEYTTLNARVSKFLAAKGIFPIRELKRSFDTLFLLETAANFPPDQWVPIYVDRLRELEKEDNTFWHSVKPSREDFLSLLGIITLIFAPNLEDQPIVQYMVEKTLLWGNKAWASKDFSKYIPEKLFTQHSDKFVLTRRGKTQIHPISSALKRFEHWSPSFLVKLLKIYMNSQTIGGSSYHNQQADLDLLHDKIIANASSNMLKQLLPLLSVEYRDFAGNQQEWKLFIEKLVQEVQQAIDATATVLTCYYCGAILEEEGVNCPECQKTIQSCPVCKKNLNFDDNIGQCLYCETKFHYGHLLEKVKVGGNCPVCDRTLVESEVIRLERGKKMR